MKATTLNRFIPTKQIAIRQLYVFASKFTPPLCFFKGICLCSERNMLHYRFSAEFLAAWRRRAIILSRLIGSSSCLPSWLLWLACKPATLTCCIPTSTNDLLGAARRRTPSGEIFVLPTHRRDVLVRVLSFANTFHDFYVSLTERVSHASAIEINRYLTLR